MEEMCAEEVFYRTLQPQCPECGKTDGVKFRYFNNRYRTKGTRISTFDQPCYRCCGEHFIYHHNSCGGSVSQSKKKKKLKSNMSSNAKVQNRPRQKKKNTTEDAEHTTTGRCTHSIATMPTIYNPEVAATHHDAVIPHSGHTNTSTQAALATVADDDTDILQYLMTELLSDNDVNDDDSWQIDPDILLAAALAQQQQVQTAMKNFQVGALHHDQYYSADYNMQSSSSPHLNNSHWDHQPYLFQVTRDINMDPPLDSDLDHFLQTLPPLTTAHDDAQLSHVKELDSSNGSTSANTTHQVANTDDQSNLVMADMEQQQYWCPPAEDQQHKLPVPDDLEFDRHKQPLPFDQLLEEGSYWWNINLEEADPLWAALDF